MINFFVWYRRILLLMGTIFAFLCRPVPGALASDHDQLNQQAIQAHRLETLSKYQVELPNLRMVSSRLLRGKFARAKSKGDTSRLPSGSFVMSDLLHRLQR